MPILITQVFGPGGARPSSDQTECTGDLEMMVLIDQLAYDQWANLRVIEAAGALGMEGFTRTVSSSFPSIQQTLVHILWAEELWLERWQGRSFVPTVDPGDYPTLDLIERKIRHLHADQVEFLSGLGPGSQHQSVSYLNFRGERWEYGLEEMVLHLVIHSAYHRGQLVTLLRQQGVTPPNTDYLSFVDDRSGSGS